MKRLQIRDLWLVALIPLIALAGSVGQRPFLEIPSANAQDFNTKSCAGGLFVFPSNGSVGWPYMFDDQIVLNYDGTIHRGIDIFPGVGGDTTVYAAYDGEILSTPSYLRIRHKDLGVDTYYGHVTGLSNLEKKKPVSRGQPIGHINIDTDNPKNTHLHFAVVQSTDDDDTILDERYFNHSLDPSRYFNAKLNFYDGFDRTKMYDNAIDYYCNPVPVSYIRGIVKDSAGHPISDAQVKIEGIGQTRRTDYWMGENDHEHHPEFPKQHRDTIPTSSTWPNLNQGQYYFDNVPLGVLTITASKAGVGKASVAVTVPMSTTVRVPDIVLKPFCEASEVSDSCAKTHGLDLVFVIDTTSSMREEIDAVKASATAIVQSLNDKADDYRIALVEYRDHPPQGDYAAKTDLAFTTDKQKALDAIKLLSISGGGDTPEAVYSGLLRAIRDTSVGGWRPDAVKQIILMGDAPPHDPEPVTGYRLQDVINAARSVGGLAAFQQAASPSSATQSVAIQTIAVGGYSATQAVFGKIAAGTAGRLFVSTASSDIVQTLLAAIDQAASAANPNIYLPIVRSGGRAAPAPPASPAGGLRFVGNDAVFAGSTRLFAMTLAAGEATRWNALALTSNCGITGLPASFATGPLRTHTVTARVHIPLQAQGKACTISGTVTTSATYYPQKTIKLSLPVQVTAAPLGVPISSSLFSLAANAPSTASIVNGQYQPFTVVATVKNTGSDPATSVALQLTLPDALEADNLVQPIGNLAPGQQLQISWNVRIAQGTPTTGLALSYGVTAVGSNTDPQSVERQIALPALGSAIDLEVTDIQAAAAPICAGSNVDFTASMRNNGSSESGFFDIRWNADGTLADGGHNSIPAGTTDGHGHIWENIPQGQHTLTFIADFDNLVTESNESNNQRTITFTAVNCSPSGPTAAFDASPLNGNAPLTVSMHNISTGSYTNCAWSYGDGTTGTPCDAYHDHTYTSPGVYTVQLTVSGPGGSNTTSQPNYITVSPASSNCTTSASAWQNRAVAAQTGTFIAEFDATPNASPMDGVMGLSAGPASAYSDLAVIARFNPQGFIDGRNGAAYQAVSQIPYTPGLPYHFRLEISIPNHTYNIFVTPAGGSEQLVGANFAFRAEQSTVASLANFALYAAAGSHQLCNVSISPAPNFANLGGTWVGSLSQGGSLSFFLSSADTIEDGYAEPVAPACSVKFHDFGPATIIGNRFIDHWQGNSYSVTVVGTFYSSTFASGQYTVIDNTSGTSCSEFLSWSITR